MAEVTFLIPEKDADRTQALERHLRDVVGLKAVRIAHQPFDPSARMRRRKQSRNLV